MWINPTKIPFITGVITHLLSGMSHQVAHSILAHISQPLAIGLPGKNWGLLTVSQSYGLENHPQFLPGRIFDPLFRNQLTRVFLMAHIPYIFR